MADAPQTLRPQTDVAAFDIVPSGGVGSGVRVFHIVGQSQYEGTCKMHLYRDCTYLTRPRSERGWDRTGAIHEDTHALTPKNTCKVCGRRSALAEPGRPGVHLELGDLLALLRKAEPADFVRIVREAKQAGRYEALLSAAGVRVVGNAGTSATRKIGNLCATLHGERRNAYMAAFFDSPTPS